MTTHELIELAVLDALALLDDEEQADFERAFTAAAPSVQAHVRREQTRFSNIDAWLPGVSPPVELRAKVVQAVRSAMAEAAAQAGLDHKIHAPGRETNALIPSRRVSPLWRASALGLATAAGVMIVAVLQMRVAFENIESTIRSDVQLQSEMTSIGSAYFDDVMYSPRTRWHHFTDADPEDNRHRHARFAVLSHDDWDGAVLHAMNFEPEDGVTYRLVVLDKNDRPTGAFADIPARFGRLWEEVDLKIQADTRLAVYAYAPGKEPEAVFVMA